MLKNTFLYLSKIVFLHFAFDNFFITHTLWYAFCSFRLPFIIFSLFVFFYFSIDIFLSFYPLVQRQVSYWLFTAKLSFPPEIPHQCPICHFTVPNHTRFSSTLLTFCALVTLEMKYLSLTWESTEVIDPG